MDAEEILSCPKCKNKLLLKQINFDSAVYICSNLQCPYPVGDKCIEVKRSYRHMNKKGSSEAGKLLEKITNEMSQMTKNEAKQQMESTDDENLTKLLSECDNKSMETFDAQEIDDFLNELLK